MKKKAEFALDDRSLAGVEETDAYHAKQRDLRKYSKDNLFQSLEYWREWYFRHDRQIDGLQTQLATARALITSLVTINSASEPVHLTPEQRERWKEWTKAND